MSRTKHCHKWLIWLVFARSTLRCRANGQTPLHLSGTAGPYSRVWFHNCKTYYLQVSAPSCIHGVSHFAAFYLALWLIVSCNITRHCYVSGFWYACATTRVSTPLNDLSRTEAPPTQTLHEDLYVHMCSHMMLSGTACVYSAVRSTNNESKSDGGKAQSADRRDP